MSLSLCLVARDEAALIADAIASARPIADEAVVVDTGSSDDTAAIARRAGARVVHAPWPADLGEAHNLPLPHARGDWVLVLDADEVLDPERCERVGELITAGTAEAYSLPVRNYTYGHWDRGWRRADPCEPLTRGASGYIPTTQVRLFRHDPAHRFTGALHQTIVPSIRANGGRIVGTDVPIHHYGFLRFDRDKSPLYRQLASRHAAAHPDHPGAWIDLGITLLERDLVPDAADAFRRARRLGDRGDASFLLGSVLLEMEAPAAAVPLLQESLAAPAERSHHFDPADAHESLGQAFEELDRPDAAETSYRQAAADGKPAAIANLAGVLLDRGRLAEATQLLDQALVDFPGIDVLWSLRGVAWLRAGESQAACEALKTALDIRPENLAARSNLAVAYRRLGRPEAAARAATAALEGLGSDEGTRIDLDRRLSREVRDRGPVELPSGPGLVLSLIPALAGGGGRVLVDAVRALTGRPQVVACTAAYDFGGHGLRQELAAMGVPVVALPTPDSLATLLERVRPALVLQHWWRGAEPRAPLRLGDTRWACIGHAPLPMPHGHDRYAVNSAFHRSRQGHLPPERLVDLPNGVDLDRFRPAVASPDDGPVTIVMLSRLDPGKFPRTLLDSLPSLQGAQLLVAGGGARRHEIGPELADRGLTEQVRFLGPIPSTEVPGLLGRADIGLHLTEMHLELCSMSLLEMLASGLPIVAEPKGGIPEMVTDGINGFLCTGPEAVAGRLRQLIDNAQLRRRMGAASRQVAKRYDMESYAGRLRAFVGGLEHRGSAQELRRRPLDVPVEGSAAAPNITTRAPLPSLSYLVCSTPRAGSTLLCEALANTGLAGHPGEYFSPDLEASTAGWLDAETAEDYLAALVADRSTPNGVFGVKVMAGQMPRLLSALQRTRGVADEAATVVLDAVFPGVRFVWLRRADRLRQAISWCRAEQTGQWIGARGSEVLAAPAPPFDRETIRSRVEVLARLEQWWDDFFVAAGITPTEVWYEELCGDYEGTARRVVAALGVAVPDDLVLGRRRLVRQADDVTEEWVSRFRDDTP